MGRETGQRQRKEARVQASARHHFSSPALAPRDAALDHDVIIENIDPAVIGTAEIDAIEEFFDDIVIQALRR